VNFDRATEKLRHCLTVEQTQSNATCIVALFRQLLPTGIVEEVGPSVPPLPHSPVKHVEKRQLPFNRDTLARVRYIYLHLLEIVFETSLEQNLAIPLIELHRV
jgi:hypothetical protein